jgi:hypothetical protein
MAPAMATMTRISRASRMTALLAMQMSKAKP